MVPQNPFPSAPNPPFFPSSHHPKNSKQRFNRPQVITYISYHNNYIAAMCSNYRRLMTSQTFPGQPSVTLDLLRRSLFHVYESVPLQTSNFQTEVNYYLNRKESYSGCVVVVSKIKDQQITYRQGRAAMNISVVTDYVPWRLHLENELTIQQALFLLEGACRGFRELLHRVHSPFIIQGSMIGVDSMGNVKVWWNELFYKSNFGFTMNQGVKLRDMVRSLIQVVAGKMKRWEAYELEGKLGNDETTFVTLEERVKALAKGCDFKEIGKGMIVGKEEYQVAMRESGISVRNNSRIVDPLRLSCGPILTPNTSQRLLLTPRKHQPLQFSRKVITKRTYQGKSPSNQEKLHIIKRDIDYLRAVVEKNPLTSDSQAKLRSSRSVDAIFSYQKGLTGDMRIPEVNKIIKQSEVLGPSEELMISRFVEPAINSSTSIQANDPYTPEKQANDHTDHLFLSRLQNLVGQDKSINSTSRSINDSRLEKIMSSDNLKSKFGESQKKLPQSVYFTNLMEM